jgi:hypothetical protein
MAGTRPAMTEKYRQLAEYHSAADLTDMRQGERTDLVEPSASLQKVSVDEAALRTHVSPRSVATAKEVKKTGIGDLQDAVRQGYGERLGCRRGPQPNSIPRTFSPRLWNR